MRLRHHDLEVWQEAIELVSHVYRATSDFPREEVFGLTSQMRRAAVSVPCNIAEGAARGTDKDFLRFLMMARGSLVELDTQLRIAHQLGFLPVGRGAPAARSLERVFALLSGLVTTLRDCGTRASSVSRLSSPQPAPPIDQED